MRNPRLNGSEQFTGSMERGRGPDDAAFGRQAHEVALSNPLQVIRRRLWVIALVTVVVVAAAAGFSFSQTPEYEASIKILVAQDREGGAPDNLQNEVQGLQQLTATMAEAVRTRPVAQAVLQKLNLPATPNATEAFLNSLTVEQLTDTQFIQVTYEDFSPERAQLVANAVGEEFEKQVSEESPSSSAITVSVWEGAALPDDPVSPDPIRNMLLALVLGLMLGVGLAFLLDRLDSGRGSPDEVERALGIPVYAMIPTFKVQKGAR